LGKKRKKGKKKKTGRDLESILKDFRSLQKSEGVQKGSSLIFALGCAAQAHT
jgi:hypothetical protein